MLVERGSISSSPRSFSLEAEAETPIISTAAVPYCTVQDSTGQDSTSLYSNVSPGGIWPVATCEVVDEVKSADTV